MKNIITAIVLTIASTTAAASTMNMNWIYTPAGNFNVPTNMDINTICKSSFPHVQYTGGVNMEAQCHNRLNSVYAASQVPGAFMLNGPAADELRSQINSLRTFINTESPTQTARFNTGRTTLADGIATRQAEVVELQRLASVVTSGAGAAEMAAYVAAGSPTADHLVYRRAHLNHLVTSRPAGSPVWSRYDWRRWNDDRRSYMNSHRDSALRATANVYADQVMINDMIAFTESQTFADLMHIQSTYGSQPGNAIAGAIQERQIMINLYQVALDEANSTYAPFGH